MQNASIIMSSHVFIGLVYPGIEIVSRDYHICL